MSALREALESAIAEQESAPQTEAPAVEAEVELDAQPVEAAESVETSEEARARDEKGRFAAKQPEAEEAQPEIIQEQPAIPDVKAPSSWKPAAQQAFLKAKRGEVLTPEEISMLAQEAERREGDFHKGVQEWKSHADRSRAYEQAIQPFSGYLSQLGVDAPQAFAHLLKTEYTLRTSDPVTKLQMFQKLAQDYNVDLSQLGDVPQVDPQTQYLMNELQSLRNQQEMWQNRIQEQEMSKAMSVVEQMAQDAANFPHFEAVRGDMADLLETGKAKSEKEAYEMAVWMRPDIRQSLLDQQRAEAQRKALDQAQAQKAKAAAVSVKGSSPTSVGTQPVKGSLRDVIAAQFNS